MGPRLYRGSALEERQNRTVWERICRRCDEVFTTPHMPAYGDPPRICRSCEKPSDFARCVGCGDLDWVEHFDEAGFCEDCAPGPSREVHPPKEVAGYDQEAAYRRLLGSVVQ